MALLAVLLVLLLVPPPLLVLAPPPANRLRSTGTAEGAPGTLGESSGDETAARREGDMHEDVGSFVLSSDRPTN